MAIKKRPTKRTVKSSVDRLPKAVREQITKLRRDQGATIDEIMAHLEKLQVAISRSALGRHTQKLDSMVVHLQETRILSEALVKQFGEESDDKVARANLELLQSALLRLQMAAHEAMAEGADGDEPREFPFSPKDIMQLSTAMQRLASAGKTIDDRIRKAREYMRQQAVDAVDRVAKKSPAGLSKDTVADIKREILGIAA